RDEYLCREELKTLTSFVEVLAAGRPEVKTAAIFATILEGSRRSRRYLADSVLLAANMFDQISQVPVVRGEITLEDLRQEPELIDSLLRILGELAQDDWSRMALTCGVSAGRDARWGPVAAALAAGGQPGAAAAIRGYLADGGIERLRAMIADQIATRALPTMLDELMTLRDELIGELASLRNLLRPVSAGAAGRGAPRPPG